MVLKKYILNQLTFQSVFSGFVFMLNNVKRLFLNFLNIIFIFK